MKIRFSHIAILLLALLAFIAVVYVGWKGGSPEGGHETTISGTAIEVDAKNGFLRIADLGRQNEYVVFVSPATALTLHGRPIDLSDITVRDRITVRSSKPPEGLYIEASGVLLGAEPSLVNEVRGVVVEKNIAGSFLRVHDLSRDAVYSVVITPMTPVTFDGERKSLNDVMPGVHIVVATSRVAQDPFNFRAEEVALGVIITAVDAPQTEEGSNVSPPPPAEITIGSGG